jgi:hypothetical protein
MSSNIGFRLENVSVAALRAASEVSSTLVIVMVSVNAAWTSELEDGSIAASTTATLAAGTGCCVVSDSELLLEELRALEMTTCASSFKGATKRLVGGENAKSLDVSSEDDMSQILR